MASPAQSLTPVRRIDVFANASEIGALLAGKGVALGRLTSVLSERYGDRVALEDDAPSPGLHSGGPRTHRDLETGVARLAAAHRAAGVQDGDRVLVLVGNRIDIILHALAITRLGAVAVPVNSRLTLKEIAAIATAAGAVAAVADDDVVADHDDTPELSSLRWQATGTGDAAGSVANWLADHPTATVAAPEELDPSEVAMLLATSGTTGLPKAAALTSRGLLAGIGRLVAVPVGRERGLRGGRDLLLAALPLTHVMGFAVTLGGLVAGVPVLHRERFHADDVLDLIEERRPNVFIGVPTMYADLEAAGIAQRDVSSVQLWGSSADAMPAERAKRFRGHGAAAMVAGRPVGDAAFIDIYGMVELSGAAAARVYPPSVVPGLSVPSVSVVLPGIDVRVVDEEGEPLGWGKVGELQFRGASVLQGYEGRPDSGPTEQGWFSTGDQGRVWPGGVFAFTGRSRDRIKVGGFSVFPAEVEHELTGGAGVHELAIVGVPDDRLGERLVALVDAEEGFDPSAWLEWAHDQVAGYRRPTAVVIVDAIPRGNHGKIDRPAASELALARRGDAVEADEEIAPPSDDEEAL